MAKKAPSTLPNMLLSLTLIAVVAALALALTSAFTQGPIEKAQKNKTDNAIREVLPAFDHLEQSDGIAMAYDKQDQLTGIAIESTDMNGFGGPLKIMVGFDAEGVISGYQVLISNETPGLGAKAATWFQKEGKGCIIGLKPEPQFEVKKDGGCIDAISGSTITSRAFCRAVNNAYNTFNQAKSGQAVTDAVSQATPSQTQKNVGKNK